jgi:hypothetical protein
MRCGSVLRSVVHARCSNGAPATELNMNSGAPNNRPRLAKRVRFAEGSCKRWPGAPAPGGGDRAEFFRIRNLAAL